jgi:hypothetical protein
MKKIAVFLGATAILFSSSAVFAQQAGTSMQVSTTVVANNGAGNADGRQSTDANASASAGRNGAAIASDAQSSAEIEMHPVNGELVGKLDSKTAKTGDPVVVKTTQAFRTSEGVVIPKGSRMIGHVTEVQTRGNGSQDSRVGIQFDRAELKSGESFRVQSMIESVAPPANAMAAASMDNGEDMGMVGGGGGRAMGGGHAGGGLLGGGASAVTSTTAGVGSGLGRTVAGSVGGSVDATSGLTSNAGAAVGNSLNGAGGATSGLEAHATSVPGVMLQAGMAGSASGVLSASKRNVHLDSGTQMTLGVAGAVGR